MAEPKHPAPSVEVFKPLDPRCGHTRKTVFEFATGFTRCVDCGARFLAPAPPRSRVQ